MTTNTDDNDPPSPEFPAISEAADIEVENDIPFTDSVEAFHYDSGWLNRAARSLRAGMRVIIDNDRTPFIVTDTKWIPTGHFDGGTDLDLPYSVVPHSDAVNAGPEDDCEFVAILKKEGLDDCRYSLRVIWTDTARPLLARYEGTDLPDNIHLETNSEYSPSTDWVISRLARIPPNQITTGEKGRASELLDRTFRIQGSGPSSSTSLSDYDLAGPGETAPGEIPSLPSKLDAIGRCPSCTSAVVRDIEKDRVVCVDCRRWCTTQEWQDWHRESPDGDESGGAECH